MINPKGPKCRLRASYSKKEEDIEFKYPLGNQSVADGHFLYSAIDRTFIKELTDRGYDIKTLKFSICIDWASPLAKERFPTLFKEIQESIPTNYDQLSLWNNAEVSDGGSVLAPKQE